VPARWSALADMVPIQLFAFGYFALAMRRFLHLGMLAAATATAAFLASSFGLTALLAPLLPAGARGSAGYASFLVALLATAWLARRSREGAAARGLALAGGVFAVSLTVRSVDQAVCPALPTGTHFLWHLLNAAVLFVLLRTALLSRTLSGVVRT
jgi:hypothetical protein